MRLQPQQPTDVAQDGEHHPLDARARYEHERQLVGEHRELRHHRHRQYEASVLATPPE
jgi:hypothetical protein